MHDGARVTTKAAHRVPIKSVCAPSCTLQTCWFSVMYDMRDYFGVRHWDNHYWIKCFIRELRWDHVSSAQVINHRCLSVPGYMSMSPGQAPAVNTWDIWAFISSTESNSIVRKLEGHRFNHNDSQINSSVAQLRLTWLILIVMIENVQTFLHSTNIFDTDAYNLF